MPPQLVILRRTPHNRTSIAALLAVLEAELPAGAIEPTVCAGVDDAAAASSAAPPLVLFSFMTAQAQAVADEVARLRRRHGRGLLLAAGGAHPSAEPTGALRLGFDWIVPGEAGPRFAGLVRAVAAGQPLPPGVLPVEERQALDRYPPWACSGQLYSMLEISRGCPHGCRFCQTPALHGRAMRHRSLPALEAALRRSAASGHRHTRFVAPNAFAYGSVDGRSPDLAAVRALLRTARAAGMQEVFLGSFPSEVRPESVNEELLALVRDQCDNRNIVVGLQTGSEALLRRLGRGHSVADGLRAVELIARAGLQPRVDLIFGLPGATSADAALTRQLILRICERFGARINAHKFTPLPGTSLADATPTAVDDETLALLDELTGRGQCAALPRLLR